jgi:hypothetical protein
VKERLEREIRSLANVVREGLADVKARLDE